MIRLFNGLPGNCLKYKNWTFSYLKFREQKVYILRGTVVVAPVKYTEKKKRKKRSRKKYTNVLDYVEWLICKFGAIVAVIEPFIKLDDSIMQI